MVGLGVRLLLDLKVGSTFDHMAWLNCLVTATSECNDGMLASYLVQLRDMCGTVHSAVQAAQTLGRMGLPPNWNDGSVCFYLLVFNNNNNSYINQQ